MPKLFFPLIIVVFAALGFVLFSGKIPVKCPAKSGTAQVSIREDEFVPQTLTIKRCTEVTFKNDSDIPAWPASDLHPTHRIYPEFDPQQGFDPGKSWSFVFDRVGKWNYHNHLSPGVRGTIIVTQ